MLNNFNRKSNKYGDLHFVSFLSAVLSRFAYLDDNKFLTNYNAIIGPVIQPKLLQDINSVNQNNLSVLLDDQTLFGLNKSANDIFSNYEYQYNGKNFLDFIALNMPENVNILNGDIKGITSFPVSGQPTDASQVKYISIGWSNYGEVYVVADKRMPNTLFLIFRGTYSAKTAALYCKPTSAIPLTVCKDSVGNPEQFLYGIFKATTEMIHTIVETMRYLATNFLGATQPNSVKIFTTGHSLGGAMCTNFAYLWMGIKKTAPYNEAPYNVLADNLICISLGAPRCMSSSVAKKFCNFVSSGKILYLRITSNGDPVPALPPKLGFEHPCSQNSEMREEISEACASQLIMRPTPNIAYSANLDCLNTKGRPYIPNMLSHTVYLDILYTNAVDIVNFIKGVGMSKEVLRTSDGNTVCRLVMGSNGTYSAIFFDVNNARQTSSSALPNSSAKISGGAFFTSTTPSSTTTTTTTTPSSTTTTTMTPTTTTTMTPTTTMKQSVFKIGGPVSEDTKMTMNAFNVLIEGMVPLSGNLCPQQGKMSNPFNAKLMPDLSCPGAKFGGRQKKSRKNKKSKRSKKSKRRNTRKH